MRFKKIGSSIIIVDLYVFALLAEAEPPHAQGHRRGPRQLGVTRERVLGLLVVMLNSNHDDNNNNNNIIIINYYYYHHHDYYQYY